MAPFKPLGANMLALIILVWALSDGEMRQYEYRAEQQFSTIEECKQRGVEAIETFSSRVEEVIGAGYMCIVPTNTHTPAPPGSHNT